MTKEFSAERDIAGAKARDAEPWRARGKTGGAGGSGAGLDSLAGLRFGDPAAIELVISGAVDLRNRDGGAAVPLGTLGEYSPEVAGKVAHSTGVSVSDAQLELDPDLAHAGKRGAAYAGKRVGLAPASAARQTTLAHEAIHVVQQRRGAAAAPSVAIAEREARAGAQSVVAGEVFRVKESAPEIAFDDGREAEPDAKATTAETLAQEVEAILIKPDDIKSHVEAQLSGGKRVLGHLHVLAEAEFHTTFVEKTQARINPSSGVPFTREEAEAFYAKHGKNLRGFRHESELYVHEKRGADVHTATHEAMHLLSSPVFAETVGLKTDEGTAEFFARLVLDESSISYDEDQYRDVYLLADLIANRVGNEALAKAYFDGEFGAFRTELESAAGDADTNIYEEVVALLRKDTAESLRDAVKLLDSF